MPTEPPPSRIREYTPRDEKQVRFIIGQAQMEALAYANKSSEDDNTNFPLFQADKPYIYFSSVLSSAHSRHMDWPFVHVRSVHGLVAKFNIRDLELVAGPPCVFRPSGAHNVPC